MKSYTPTLLTTALLATILIRPANGEPLRTYSAAAYGLESNELLYVEKHVERWKEGQIVEREVRYEDPDGDLIAEKIVRYGESVAAPSFEMRDHRIGLQEGVEVRPDSIELYSGPSGAQDLRSVQRPEVAVIDAGFDAFMRENFSTILEGESLEFEFAVPSARRFFQFVLLPQGTVAYDGEEAVLVKMKPASRLLRLLVDPIELVYGLDGRLLEFRGLANVWNREGDRYKARIVFDYPPSYRNDGSNTIAP